MESYRSKRRRPMYTLAPGILLIGAGVWVFLSYQAQPDAPLTPGQIATVLFAAFGLSALIRAALIRRREAGLLFLGGFITLGAGSIAGLSLLLEASPTALWPLLLIAMGLSLLLTMLLKRTEKLGLVALSSILAGLIALPYTLNIIPPEMVGVVKDGWPVFFITIGLLTLIAAFGYREEEIDLEAVETGEPDEDKEEIAAEETVSEEKENTEG